MVAATASATDDFLNSLNINDTIDDVMAETEPQQSPKPIKQVYNLTESLESLKNFKNSISEITQQKLEDFNDKLKTSRNENVKIVKVASNNGIELITNDFNKLLKSYEDFLSNNNKEINQESIKTHPCAASFGCFLERLHSVFSFRISEHSQVRSDLFRAGNGGRLSLERFL